MVLKMINKNLNIDVVKHGKVEKNIITHSILYLIFFKDLNHNFVYICMHTVWIFIFIL